jgi:hypothetical protein
MNDIVKRANNLTQRLDHMVPDTKLSLAANQKAAAELAAISEKLYELLPDPSLSPIERLERLGRVIEKRDPDIEQLKPAHEKVSAIKERLNHLLPGDEAALDKVEKLIAILGEVSPKELRGASPIRMLESLGDPRGQIEPE